MGIRFAYGSRDNIDAAIQAEVIPKECIILTDDTEDTAEMLFRDHLGVLKNISERQKFQTMTAAKEWAETYDCTGTIFSVCEDGAWNLYVVQDDGVLSPAGLTGSENIFLDGGNSSGL